MKKPEVFRAFCRSFGIWEENLEKHTSIHQKEEKQPAGSIYIAQPYITAIYVEKTAMFGESFDQVWLSEWDNRHREYVFKGVSKLMQPVVDGLYL